MSSISSRWRPSSSARTRASSGSVSASGAVNMEVARVVVAEGSPADIVISLLGIFRRSHRRRASLARQPSLVRSVTRNDARSISGPERQALGGLWRKAAISGGLSADLQTGLELLQGQPLEVGLRGPGGADYADLDAGGRIDGHDLDGGADWRELEIDPAAWVAVLNPAHAPRPESRNHRIFRKESPLNGATTQQAALAFRKVGPGVDRASVVPHQEVAELPDVLENEFAPLADLVKLLQDHVAFVRFEPFDARSHEPVDEQRFAPGVRMRDEHRVVMMRNAADIGREVRPLGALVFMDVQRLLALELLFQRRRHRLVGPVHIGEQRVAAGGRQLERMEERVFVGPRRIA